MVAEAAGVSDFSYSEGGFAKHPRSGCDSRLGDELVRRQAKEPLGQPRKSLRRKFGAERKPGGSNVGREVLFEFFESTSEVLGNLVRLNLYADVARKSNQADYGTLRIQNRQLCRQAPDRVIGSMPLHFQVVNQRTSRTQNFLVLFGRNPAEVAWAYVTRAFAEDLRLALQAVPGHQRLVHGNVATCNILHEKGNVRRAVEESFEQADLQLRNVPR